MAVDPGLPVTSEYSTPVYMNMRGLIKRLLTERGNRQSKMDGHQKTSSVCPNRLWIKPAVALSMPSTLETRNSTAVKNKIQKENLKNLKKKKKRHL